MSDLFTALLGLCAGLAILLYSMKMTSGALEAVAGDKLKPLLRKIAGNRFTGVLVGAGITALIQSSTATTVMVIGFVNIGAMDLYQALWIIMGANIGTNITSQLIAFNIGDYAAIPALIGAFMIMFCHSKKWKNIGEVITGLGFIFLSLNMMVSSMAPIAQTDYVKTIFASINNPVIGVIVGMLFAALMHSSAAGMGVLQAMAVASAGSGVIELDQAMYIIFGMNIGTCVTAIMAAIGTTRNAIRASLMHFIFNVTGTVLFSIIAYFLPLVKWVEALSPDNPARQFANMHLIFNLGATALLLPAGKLIVKLVEIILPDKGGDAEGIRYLKYLNERMLTPDYQLGTEVFVDALTKEIGRMLVMASVNVQRSLTAVIDNSEKIQAEINDTEEYVDYLNKEISYYISHTMVFDLNEKDALTMSALFKITGNIERMGDHATNIAGYADMLENKKLSLSDKAQGEVEQMISVTDKACRILLGEKPKSVHIKMAQMEQKIDDMTDDYREHQLQRMKSGTCSGDACVVYSEMLTDFERLGDHMLNIAEAAAETGIPSFGGPAALEEYEAEKTEAEGGEEESKMPKIGSKAKAPRRK